MTTQIQRRPDSGGVQPSRGGHHPAGIARRPYGRARRRQRHLSDRVHATGDERARQHGWTVSESTGRFGFGVRTYRDPRFDARPRQLSHAAAQPAGRGRAAVPAEWPSGSSAEPRPAEDQVIGWNETSNYWNKADDCESDREAGE